MTIRRAWTRAATAILIVGFVCSSNAVSSSDSIRDRLLEYLPREALMSRTLVTEFYQSRDWAPVWSQGEPAHALIHSLLHYLEGMRADGLDPGDFHADDLTALAHFHDRRLSTEDLARRDLLLTDAVFSLGRMHLGALIDPGSLYESWSSPTRDADLVTPLGTAMLSGHGLFETLEDLRPQDPTYLRLRDAHTRYLKYAADGGWPELGRGADLRYGDTDPRVAALRARLSAEGYEVATAGPHDLFDEALAVAVAAFQIRHGLHTDGIVGASSLAELNVPAEARAAQIAVNLARLRWLPRDLGERYIRVNIPEFRLEIVERGEIALSMRAVVGRVDRPTPVLSGALTYLEVNPYWNIPQTIARKDVLPQVQRDPAYLVNRNIRVYESWLPEARELESQTIDWQSIGARQLAFKLRQEPGPGNALGQIKFMFANSFSVYIHDTPSRSKFSGRQRCFSSGCIRVEHPLTLAAYLLREKDPDGETLLRAVDSRKNTILGLPQPVPVHLIYLTAWSKPDGTTHFRNDIYDYDGALRTALVSR